MPQRVDQRGAFLAIQSSGDNFKNQVTQIQAMHPSDPDLVTFIVEDLKLNVVESLQGVPYLETGKYLCGPATDKRYMLDLGIGKDDFNAMTRFTSWAVDIDHGLDLCGTGWSSDLRIRENEHVELDLNTYDKVKDLVKNMKAMDRAVIGLMYINSGHQVHFHKLLL
ncbi:hypothetical protein BC332_25901 [Capsicum chinense]|nr:hypothetical protein BC332_25901 [Capsicum chinense]